MDNPEKSSTMENKLRHKFTIPKIKRDADKVCIIQCTPEKREYTNILDTLDKGRLNMNCELKLSWEFSQLKLVLNNDLERRFFEKRNEMKELGRNIRELEEKYCFLMVPYQSAETICNHGISVGNMATKVLGNPHMGTYLFRHVDVALNFTHQRDLTSNVVVVFKVLFGKVRKVHGVSPKKTALDPTPNFDSHMSKHLLSWNVPFDEQAKNSLIYVYEYDSSLKPAKTPRQCLPIAFITATFLSQNTTLHPARLPSKPVSSGSDAFANCTVAQRIGKGRDATVVFHSVHTPVTKPSLREISQNSDLQDEAQTIPVLNKNDKCEDHVSTPMFQNQISLPSFCVPYNHFCISLESLIMSSMMISSKSIKDPRLLKRCEHEFGKYTSQCHLGQQNQKEYAFENEMSTLKEKDPSKENLGTLENNGGKTSLYLSFEEARFSDENYLTKELEIKNIDENQEVKADDQYLTEQRRQSNCIFDNDVSSIKEKDFSKERENSENNISKTSFYLSFEEARFSDDKDKVKEQVRKTEKKQSSILTFTENVESIDTQPLQYLPMKEKSELSSIQRGYGTSQTLHNNQVGGTKEKVPVRLSSSLENTSSPPRSVNQSNYPAKIKDKNHLLQNKSQLLSSGINRGQSEDSDSTSPKQTQKDILQKVVLYYNKSNEPLSSEKLTEDKSAEGTTQPETLQSHQNSVYTRDKKVCSNGNSKLGTTKAPVKTSLASRKENLEQDAQSESCMSNPDLKAKKTADHTSPQKHLSTSPFHLNTKFPEAAEKCLKENSPVRKAIEQHLSKKEKGEPMKTVPAASPKEKKEDDKPNTTSNLTNDLSAKNTFSAPIHKVYNDTNEKEPSSKSSLLHPVLCTSKQDIVVKRNCEMDLVAKNLHFNGSVAKSQTEKTRIYNSLMEKVTYDDIHFDSLCMTQLESRIDWKGIFGMQKDKVEEIADLQKPSRKLREPSGLRIFPDMEITIGNSHYVCKEQDVNSFVEVHSSKAVKEKINNNFEKEVPSGLQKTSSVSEIVTYETSPMSQVCKADNRPELLSHCVRIGENLHSDRQPITENQVKFEVTDDNKSTCVKTGRNFSHSKTTKQKLSSTRRHSIVFRRSVRRMNKFSQSEKNLKMVLGLLSGEIPLCKSKRISKRLDRAILHLRKAHKRVQKSLQIVSKPGRCNVTETLQDTETCSQENHIKNLNTFKRKMHNGKRIDTKGKQAESVKVGCKSKQMLQIPNSLKVAVSEKHEQKSSPAGRKCLNMLTEVGTGISSKDSLLAATSDNSPKISPPSPPNRNSVVVATESSADSPSVRISDIEKAVPKSTTEKKEVSTEKCRKVKKDKKEIICTKKILLQAKKHHSCHTKIKTYKKKTNPACEKIQHSRNKMKRSMFATEKNPDVSRLLLEKLSTILQNAAETHNLKRLRDGIALCKKLLPIFIKSFERKQKCAWRDVIVDRKLLFFHHLKTCFRSTLQPRAVESFLELQMMIEVTQFIENRICFFEGRPTFRSLLWYDRSLYRELLAGEAGYQQQSHFYNAFQEKLNDSAVTTLNSHSSRLSEFLQEIDDKNSSYYVYLKYKRELRECEDVLKHDCDYSAFSLSIPFSCGAHLGDTVEDLAALQKSTLEIISRFIQLPKVEPGLKEHALCLLEIISAKIDFLKTSVSLSMNLSLFGIEHLLFDAAKMMVFKERKALDREKKIVLTKEIIGQINSNALSKLYEVFCVPGEETWVASDIDELWNENLNSQISLSSHNDKFLVGKIIDQARHAEPSLLKQMIIECQKHLDFQIKSFQILQECDIEKALIKDSNVQELTQRKHSLTTLIKAEAVEPYIELVMTYETLHFLYCVMAAQRKQDTKRGLLWYESSLLSDLVQIQKRLVSFLTGTMMPSAIDTIESKIVDIKSELEVISNCSDSVNYTYAFQIMTRELSELSELKQMVKLNSAIDAYIHISPCVVSLHYGSLSAELDYNYSQFSDFLGILVSSPKKDLGKMTHTMKIMKTIELAKAFHENNNNSSFDLITCQILQNSIRGDHMINKTPNGGKPKMLNDQSPRKRKYTSPEDRSSKKEKVGKPCEKSPEKEKKEKVVFQSSTEPDFDVNVSQKNESQSPLKKHCMKTAVNDVRVFVNASSKCRKKTTDNSVEISKRVQKNNNPCSPSQHSLSPNKVSMSCSPNPSPRSSVSTDKFCSASNSKNDQNHTDRKDSESLSATRSDPKITNELSDIPARKIDDEASNEKETFLARHSEGKDFPTLDKSLSDARPIGEQKDCQENPAGQKTQEINPPNGQQAQSNCDGWNNQPMTSANSLYPHYPGSSNPWQQSSYLWYQFGAHNNALSQTFPGVSYDAQNINPYNQTSGFPTLASYSTNQPYSNFMGQIQPQGYPASGAFGAAAPYNYSASSSTSNQNSVPVPYSYTSTVMAGWSWNSWQ